MRQITACDQRGTKNLAVAGGAEESGDVLYSGGGALGVSSSQQLPSIHVHSMKNAFNTGQGTTTTTEVL